MKLAGRQQPWNKGKVLDKIIVSHAVIKDVRSIAPSDRKYQASGKKEKKCLDANNTSTSVRETDGREITALITAHSKEERSIPNCTVCQLSAQLSHMCHYTDLSKACKQIFAGCFP